MQMKPFRVCRKIDNTGISGTGVIAHGCILPSNRVVIEWTGTVRSIVIYESYCDMMMIMGHNGETTIEFLQ